MAGEDCQQNTRVLSEGGEHWRCRITSSIATQKHLTEVARGVSGEESFVRAALTALGEVVEGEARQPTIATIDLAVKRALGGPADTREPRLT